MKTSIYRLIFFFLAAAHVMTASSPRKAEERSFTHGNWHPKDYRFVNEQQRHLSKTNDTLSYRTMPLVTPDFLVNTDIGTAGADQMNVSIARGDDGFFCVWIDERSGQRRIDGQLFTLQGKPNGQSIHISDRFNSWNSQPDVVFNRVTKEYVVTWAESGLDIQMQRLSAAGVRIGRNFAVNDRYIINTNNPSLSITPNGGMIVTWVAEEYAGTYKTVVFHKALYRDGSSKELQQKTMTHENASISSEGWDARIAADSTGVSVIVWSEYIGNHSRIIAQPIDSTGKLIGSNVVASDPQDTSNHLFPTIASTRDGHFLMIWSTDGGIAGRILNARTGQFGPQFTIEATRSSWNMYSGSSDEYGTFFVSYSRWETEPKGECIAEIPAAGGPIAYHTGLSGMPSGNDWYYPKLTDMKDGLMLLAYFKYDKSEQNAYFRIYDRTIKLLGGPTSCVNDIGSSSQTMPVVAMSRSGRSIVLWEDQKDGDHDLSARVYDEQGAPAGPVISVNDTVATSWVSDASVTEDNQGDFIVCYAAGDYSTRSLFAQKISSAGVLIGRATTVAGPFYNFSALPNCVRQEKEGIVHVVWSESGYYYPFCRRQKLTSALSLQGRQETVINGYPGEPKIIIDLSLNSQCDLAVLWTGFNTEQYYLSKYIKATIYDKTGKLVLDTLTIDSAPDTRYYRMGKCRIDDDRNVAAMWLQGAVDNYSQQLVVARWYAGDRLPKVFSSSVYLSYPMLQFVDFRNRSSVVSWSDGTDVKGIFFNDFTQDIIPLRLAAFDSYNNRMWDGNPGYCASISGDRLLLAYADQKQWERGLDIYANIQNIAPLAFGWENTTGTTEAVFEPYPNPGASPVMLRYALRLAANVDIGVYNVLGQKVAALAHGEHQPGTYFVQFDPHSLPTGVYFFRYSGRKVYTRKFLHVK